MDKKKIGVSVMSLFICFVFIQSLFFKFTDAPETQFIFSTLDAWAFDVFGISGLFLWPGPFSAYVIGSGELVASVLLLVGLFTSQKIFSVLGALLAIAIMTGAIFFHLFTPLGVEVQGDGGTLFVMACLIWLFAAVLLAIYKKELPVLGKKFQ